MNIKVYGTKILDAIRKNRKLQLILLVFAVGLFILLYFSGQNSKDTSADVEINSVSLTEEECEKRLCATLSEIRGAGKVKVMITYDTTAELVPAMSSSRQSGSSTSNGNSTENKSEQNQPALVNNGGEQEPVVLTQIQPRVRGVIIVAEGASDISVKLNLEYAAAAVLGVSRDSIEVFEMRQAYIG